MLGRASDSKPTVIHVGVNFSICGKGAILLAQEKNLADNFKNGNVSTPSNTVKPPVYTAL